MDDLDTYMKGEEWSHEQGEMMEMAAGKYSLHDAYMAHLGVH